MKIEKIPISEIIPYENNPRKNEQAIEIVAKSIKEFGFRNPILIDEKNIILAGHTRRDAAIMLKYETAPCIRIEDLTELQKKAFRIMDNKSSEKASWDYEQLKAEFTDLKSSGYDLGMTGFEELEINSVFEDSDNDAKTTEKLGNLVITCPKCSHKFKKGESKK